MRWLGMGISVLALCVIGCSTTVTPWSAGMPRTSLEVPGGLKFVNTKDQSVGQLTANATMDSQTGALTSLDITLNDSVGSASSVVEAQAGLTEAQGMNLDVLSGIIGSVVEATVRAMILYGAPPVAAP